MIDENVGVDAPPLRDPFPGGELTPARAAKLMDCSLAEVETLITEGKLLARTGPRPGGGEHVLVAFESVQSVRAEEAPTPVPAARKPPLPESGEAELARRPALPPAAPPPTPSGAPAPSTPRGDSRTDPLVEAVERLTLTQGHLLAKLDELVEVLRGQAEGPPAQRTSSTAEPDSSD